MENELPDQDTSVATDLTLQLVEAIAPDEIDFFDEMIGSVEDFRDGERGNDNPLGFGAESLVEYVTPYVYQACLALVGFLAREAAQVGQDILVEIKAKGSEKIKGIIGDWFQVNPDKRGDAIEAVNKRLKEMKTESELRVRIIDEISSEINIK